MISSMQWVNRVSRIHNRAIAHVLDPDITGAVHDGCRLGFLFRFMLRGEICSRASR
jgi:hypothetical protein